MVTKIRSDFVISPIWKWLPGGLFFRLARLLKSGHIEETIARSINFDRLEQLPKRLAVTATDLIGGEAISFTHGSIKTALMASMNIPGLSHPIEYHGMALVDGGVLENLPVHAAKKNGADIIIGVDISGDSQTFSESSASSIKQSMNRALVLQRRKLHQDQTAAADILIQSNVRGLSMSDFSLDPEALVKIGEDATIRVMSKIKSAVAKIEQAA